MSNVENLMILSGITIISGVSLWILNKKETPKNSPKKKTPKKRSATPIRSPTPEPKSITIKEEIKTPLPTIRNTPKKLKAKTVRSFLIFRNGFGYMKQIIYFVQLHL